MSPKHSDPSYYWHKWWRPRCRARGRLPEGMRRCELNVHGMQGSHVVDAGTYVVLWTEESWTTQENQELQNGQGPGTFMHMSTQQSKRTGMVNVTIASGTFGLHALQKNFYGTIRP